MASLLTYLPVNGPSSEFGVAALHLSLGFWIAFTSPSISDAGGEV